MKLYLVQHGEAVDKEQDPARPLSEQGVRDVTRMAALLRDRQVSVSHVLHSGKRRAEQTAAIFAGAVLPAGQIKAFIGINPNDAVDNFSEVITSWQDDMLVVGHLPFMSRLVSLLIARNPDREIVSFYPGTAVCLEQKPSGEWVLLWMMRPDVLTGGP
jgi:phosphohistidine phosphatase